MSHLDSCLVRKTAVSHANADTPSTTSHEEETIITSLRQATPLDDRLLQYTALVI